MNLRNRIPPRTYFIFPVLVLIVSVATTISYITVTKPKINPTNQPIQQNQNIEVPPKQNVEIPDLAGETATTHVQKPDNLDLDEPILPLPVMSYLQAVENPDDMSYIYAINIDSSSIEKYKSGIKYVIKAISCASIPGLTGDSTFSGTIKKPIAGETKIIIKIPENYLKSKNELTKSTYTLSDIQNNQIYSGDINVPECINTGKFKITDPKISKEGKFILFQYEIDADEKAIATINKGSKLIIHNNCEDYEDAFALIGNQFERNISALSSTSVKRGFGLRIPPEAFEHEDYLENSTYKIVDDNDLTIFAGNIKTPDCK